jgi:hypothetical protein
MIKWLFRLLFKAKHLSFKNGDIFVVKVPNKTNDAVVNSMIKSFRGGLDKLGCMDSQVWILREDMDIFTLDNQSSHKSN